MKKNFHAMYIPCKKLVCVINFAGAVALFSGFPNGAIGQSIFLDSVQCVGTEATLASCPHQPIGVHDCSHVEDVGVRCQRLERKSVTTEVCWHTQYGSVLAITMLIFTCRQCM